MIESSIHSLIEKEAFFHCIQGLFGIKNGKRVGGEILLRSEMGPPDVIFQKAKAFNKLYELDTTSILKVLKTLILQPTSLNDLIFINIFPSTILHSDFPNFIKKISLRYSQFRQKIVFEIVETEYVDKSMDLLKERIELLKSLGYMIALDDVGKGWSSLSLIIELEPDFLKVDQFFSSNLSISQSKQEMIKLLLQYARYSKANVVLEGIEYEQDLAVAKKIGVDCCQGFLLERPIPIQNLA